jgi:hypothetical protein
MIGSAKPAKQEEFATVTDAYNLKQRRAARSLSGSTPLSLATTGTYLGR